MADQEISCVSGRLAEALRGAQEGQSIDVVVELREGDPDEAGRPGAHASAADARVAFEAASAPLIDFLTAAGAANVRTAWLSKSIRCVIPAERIREVAQFDVVSLVDLPVPI